MLGTRAVRGHSEPDLFAQLRNSAVSKRSKGKKPPPTALAMILCDQIITDRETGKHVIVGTFSNIQAPSLPAVHPSMAIFLALTDGKGKYKGLLRLVHAETDRVLFESHGDLEFEDPLQVLEVVMRLPVVLLEKRGLHVLQLMVDEALVVERKFNVGPVQEAGK